MAKTEQQEQQQEQRANRSAQKIVQYLYEAHAAETTQISILASHIAMTPASRYRGLLETHLRETREHAERIQKHLATREQAPGIMQTGYGFAQGIAGQVLTVTKLPLEVARGMSAEERLLKNAKDECATEALEIATYLALEQFATECGDTATARLAASIRAEEEHMLKRLQDELPQLATDVYAVEVEGRSRFDLVRTGAADAVRIVAGTAARGVSRSAGRLARRADDTTGQTRRPARSASERASTRRASTRKRSTTASRKRSTTKRKTSAR